MSKLNIVNFHDSLFTDAVKEKINQKLLNSNIISNKMMDEITSIDFHLKKEGSSEFNTKESIDFSLSVSTNFLGKSIHITKTGNDVYVLIDNLIQTLERTIRKNKEKTY